MSTSPASELVPETVDIDDLIPYWRNPRRMSSDAVEAVMESIKKYGYLQPIVVDEDMVIIIGHTRYGALRRLGYEQIEVAVAKGLSDERVRKLRILDNRVAEYNTWNFDLLMEELENLDNEAMKQFFPEVLGTEALDDGPGDGLPITWGDLPDDYETVEFVCPSCFTSWEQQVTRQMILSGTLSPEPHEHAAPEPLPATDLHVEV